MMRNDKGCGVLPKRVCNRTERCTWIINQGCHHVDNVTTHNKERKDLEKEYNRLMKKLQRLERTLPKNKIDQKDLEKEKMAIEKDMKKIKKQHAKIMPL